MHNFGQHETHEDSLVNQALGVCEEAGELAKSLLKRRQGIRGSEAEHEAKEKDAIGDIVIFAMGYCSYRRWDIHEVVNTVADEVMERDWIKYPFDGLTR